MLITCQSPLTTPLSVASSQSLRVVVSVVQEACDSVAQILRDVIHPQKASQQTWDRGDRVRRNMDGSPPSFIISGFDKSYSNSTGLNECEGCGIVIKHH